jgi:hypothetical protein
VLKTVRSTDISDGIIAYTKNRPHGHPDKPALIMSDLHELVDWGRDRRAALEHAKDASRTMERVIFDVEQRWLEAIRSQAALDGTTMTQVVHQALRAFFAEQ